jgi:tetratricopeptide (TPR) repeat protein
MDIDAILTILKEYRGWGILIIVVAIIVYAVAELINKRHQILPRILTIIPSLKHIYIAELVSDTFEGNVELITTEQLKRQASNENICEFYKGGMLNWEIIAAHGDIDRDQYSELKEKIQKSHKGMHFVCVTAEPGAGKSTLCWRLVADLLTQKNAPLIIHVNANKAPEVWRQMSEFQRKLKCPLFVLVDDIFHDDEAAEAFIDLHPDLPLTVLGTSWRDKFDSYSERLNRTSKEFPLNPPSAIEKDRALKNVLKTLGKCHADMTPQRLRRLKKAKHFLVLMKELSEGEAFKRIILKSVDDLQKVAPVIYHAHAYLCFAYQFNIPFPVSLFEKIDSSFYKLPDQEKAKGAIFWDSNPSYIRAQNAVVAKFAAKIYKARGVFPEKILQKIIAVLDYSNADERRFLAYVLRAVVSERLIDARLLFIQVKDAVLKCVQNAKSIIELAAWRNVYLICGQQNLAGQCVDMALALEPSSVGECYRLLYFCRERNEEKQALLPIAKFVNEHSDQGVGYDSYFGLVEKYSKKEIPEVIQKMRNWVNANPNDTHTRQIYFGALERNGSDKQIREAIIATNELLQTPKYSDNVRIRQAILGLLKGRWPASRKGSSLAPSDKWLKKKGLLSESDLFEQTLNANTHWLKQNPTAKEVSDVILGLMFFLKREDEALELVSKAVSLHADDQNTLMHYLHALYVSNVSPQKIKKVFEDLMKKNPEQKGAKLSHAAWLRDKCQPDEAEAYYRKLIAEYPNAYEPYCGLGQLYLNLERFSEAANEFDKVLKLPLGNSHQLARAGFGRALWKIGELVEAEGQIILAIQWADYKDESSAQFYTLLGQFYLDCKRWSDAIKAFEAAKKQDPNYYGNYFGIGRALFERGDFIEAKSNLCGAFEHKPDLQPPVRDEINALLGQCEQKLKLTLISSP